MTLFTYFSLLATAIFFIIFRVRREKSAAVLIGFVIIVWSLVIRNSEPTADVIGYNIKMAGEIPSFLLGAPTEPIMWLFQMYLFKWTEDFLLTWFIGDIILLSVLYLGIKNLRYGLYMESKPNIQTFYYPAIFIIVLISWPYFIGLSATYRQLAAQIFFLYAISVCREHTIKSFSIFLVSCLTHNAVIVFWPLLIILNRTRYFRALSVLAIVLTPMTFYLIDPGRESNIYVGQLLAMVYPVFMIFACLFLCFLVMKQRVRVSKELIFVNAFLPYVTFNAWLFLSNNQAERFGQLIIAIALPIFLVFIANKFRDKRVSLLAVCLFCVTPMFTFYRAMLI